MLISDDGRPLRKLGLELVTHSGPRPVSNVRENLPHQAVIRQGIMAQTLFRLSWTLVSVLLEPQFRLAISEDAHH